MATVAPRNFAGHSMLCPYKNRKMNKGAPVSRGLRNV